MKRVFVVIVTFNRPEMLGQCISALLRQRNDGIARIHVVVNSDDADTMRVIHSLDLNDTFITYERLNNVGPAGGFASGLQKFVQADQRSFEFCWLMDDDVLVQDHCLVQLLKDTNHHEYIYPRVIKGDGEEIVSFGWWGVLISRSLIVKVGLPISELFFWKEDTEYLQNRIMRVHGIIPYRSREATVSHLHLRKKKRPSWYYYYTGRNTLYYHQYIAGYTWYRFKKTVTLFVHAFAIILLREDNKLTKLYLMFLGICHGFIGKIGKLIDPARYG